MMEWLGQFAIIMLGLGAAFVLGWISRVLMYESNKRHESLDERNYYDGQID